MKTFWVLLYLAVTVASQGTSIIFPKFGAPIKRGDVLMFTSIDAKRLIALDMQGRKIWEKQFNETANLLEGPANAVWLQAGRNISKVNEKSGELSKLFEVEHSTEHVYFDRDASILFSHLTGGQKNMFKLLDSATGKQLWSHPQIERFIGGTTNQLFFYLSGRKRGPQKGYTMVDRRLLCLQRKNFKPIWEKKIEGSNLFVQFAMHPPYLACLDADFKVDVLDLGVGTPIATLPSNSRITTVASCL